MCAVLPPRFRRRRALARVVVAPALVLAALALLLAAPMPAPAVAESAQTALALFTRARAGEPAALAALRRGADGGDAASRFQLGRVYALGAPGLPRDDDAAARLIEQAALQGYAEAMTTIGHLYSTGRGVPHDAGKAMQWWIRAAEKGYAPAQFNLALAYQQGALLPRDEGQAFFWMSRAAAQGLPDAQLNLGIMYGRGSGTAPDTGQAIAWYRKAAEQGSGNAMTNLASMYAYGEGVPKDLPEAMRWLQQPVADGSARALAIRADVCRERAALCAAAHFVFEMPQPRLRISIPDAPAMEMGPHPLAAAQPNARYLGSAADGTTVSVLTPFASAGMTPKDCANALGEAVVRRFAVKPDELKTLQADDGLTFVLLFVYKVAPVVQLKAFLLSGGGGNCLEVHLSKTVADDSGRGEWMKGFAGARVEKY